MNRLAVLEAPGAQTTIQDAGRPGARHLGVASAGAADRVSFALANLAAGNDWRAPALECADAGARLRFEAPVMFALGGADMAARLNDTPVPLYTARMAKAGDALSLRAPRAGLRAYIALAGGVAGEAFLGSVATDLGAGVGGLAGRALKAGDPIRSAGAAPGAPCDGAGRMAAPMGPDWFLRVVPGPEYELFSPPLVKQFFSEPFRADAHSNRMGMRLAGPAIAPPDGFSMISGPVFPGTVQCPAGGAPVLLLADAQTVGGYARIAQLIDADLPLAGQIRPGDAVWFVQTTPKHARDITARKEALYSAVAPGFSFR